LVPEAAASSRPIIFRIHHSNTPICSFFVIRQKIIVFLLQQIHDLNDDMISEKGNSGTISAFTKTVDGVWWEARTAAGQFKVHQSCGNICSMRSHRRGPSNSSPPFFVKKEKKN
jgi:hypothetical protein